MESSRGISVPSTRFVAGFLGKSNLLAGTISGEGRVDLADARSNRLRAVVQAYRALGGGWK